MPVIRILSDEGPGREVPVESGLTIGRSSQCRIVLSDSRISREHAKIDYRNGQWLICDLRTNNGTLVDGKRIEEAVLRDGAQIQIADFAMVFEAQALPDAESETRDPAAVEFGDGSAIIREAMEVENQTTTKAIAASPDRGQMLRAVEAIERVSHAFHSTQSPDELFGTMTREIMATYPECDSCQVLAWDPDRRTLRPEAVEGRSGEASHNLSFSSTAVYRALDSKQGFVCANVGSHADFKDSQSVRDLAIRSFACAPILRQGDPLGALYMDSRRSDSAFSEADLRVLCVIANEAGLALHNMELLEHYVEKQRMEQALQLAHDIQASVLPDEAPPLPGFEIAGRCVPCDETSGDYYDFIELADGKQAVVIGDVSGHGIGPALLMMSARSHLRALARSREDARQLLTDLNSLIEADAHRGMWMSLFYGVLDPATSSLTYLSAGHEPAILYRRSTGEGQSLHSTGCPLGIMPEMDIDPPEVLTMTAGDVLFLCTDGIPEASNPVAEMFGRDRLLNAVVANAGKTPRSLINAVFGEVDAFRSTAPQRDDLTMVAVRAQ